MLHIRNPASIYHLANFIFLLKKNPKIKKRTLFFFFLKKRKNLRTKKDRFTEGLIRVVGLFLTCPTTLEKGFGGGRRLQIK
jgi:hypothetical protein